MTNEKTNEILCPIRGGVESRTTVHRAVSLAQETGLPVIFMYVVNPDLLSAPNMDQAEATVKKFERMGRSVLDAAQAWAGLHGVRTRGDMRWGRPAEEIATSCRNLDITYLVLGESEGTETENTISKTRMNRLVDRIENQIGVSVITSSREQK